MSYFKFCDQESDALPTELLVLPPLKISTSVKYMYICVTVIGQMTDAIVMILIFWTDRHMQRVTLDSDQTAPRGAVL